MRLAMPSNKLQKLLYIMAGLGGISLVILIHEAGHFVFAHLFNVPTAVFSIGFGPSLVEIPLGQTIFKIGLLPLGGYVEMDSEILGQQHYLPQMLIMLGGILFNMLFAYSILVYYTIRNKLSQASSLSSSQAMQQAFVSVFSQENGTARFIGPIGIISTIGKSIAIDVQLYWFALSVISFNIGLMNMIPLPFFDGGKALLYTIEALCGCTISPQIVWIVSVVSFALCMAFTLHITIHDIRRVAKR